MPNRSASESWLARTAYDQRPQALTPPLPPGTLPTDSICEVLTVLFGKKVRPQPSNLDAVCAPLRCCSKLLPDSLSQGTKGVVMKYLLPVLVLTVSIVASKVSIPQEISGGVARAVGSPTCTGKIAELVCASSEPGETCDPSSMIQISNNIEEQNYIAAPIFNSCSNKNPGTACLGLGRAPSVACVPPSPGAGL